MGRNPLPVTSAGHVLHPLLVLKIPANGFANAGFKRFLRPPTQFAFNLPRIHGIAPVVSRTVLHERDQFASRPPPPPPPPFHPRYRKPRARSPGWASHSNRRCCKFLPELPAPVPVRPPHNGPPHKSSPAHSAHRRTPVTACRRARSKSSAGSTSPETETFHNYSSNWS